MVMQYWKRVRFAVTHNKVTLLIATQDHPELMTAEQRMGKTVNISPRTVNIVERGTHVRLTIIDTPGKWLLYGLGL
jgi:hypothetical protein